MGWICKRCGSENSHGRACCAACGKWAGPVRRAGQLAAQMRLTVRSEASANDRMDRRVKSEQRFLKGQERVFRKLMLLLAAACVLLVLTQAFHVSVQDGLSVEFSHVWEARLEQLTERTAALIGDAGAAAHAGKGA